MNSENLARLTEIGYLLDWHIELGDELEPCLVCGKKLIKYNRAWRLDPETYEIKGPYCGAHLGGRT